MTPTQIASTPVLQTAASRPRFQRSHFFALIIAVLLAAPFILFRWPAYSHTDVCRECGVRRDVFALRSRFGDTSWHDFNRLREMTEDG